MRFFENSVFFGVTISIVAYGVGCVLKDKLKMDIFNPVLISIVAVIAVLACAHIDYDVYYSGAQYLSYLLTPATVCLAVPLYEKIELLKEHWKAIVAGILSGVLTTLLCVLAMSLIFGFSHEEYVTFLPEVYYYGDWNGRIGRTWWIRNDYRCNHYYYRSTGQYYCTVCV